METQKIGILPKSESSLESIVRHVYIADDGRRTTTFYTCCNDKAAVILVKIIEGG